MSKDKLIVGLHEIDYTMVPDDEYSGPIIVRKDRLDYDIPYVVSGIPGNQICIIHIDETKYSLLTKGIPLEPGIGGVTISLDGGPDYRDDWQECPYCKGTGVHLVEGYSNYYYLCRNCETHGYCKK